MNRRSFLQVSAAGFSARLLKQPAAATPLRPQIVAAIYDERFHHAQTFAAKLRRDGAAVFATRGDASALWYGALGNLLGQQAGKIAGLTTWPDLVIARSCGRELGLRLAFENCASDRALITWLLEPRNASC